MESLITTTPPPYFSNSVGGGGYLEDVLQLHYNIPNLYHPPLHLQDSTSLNNTHITSNALSTSTSESSSSISRSRSSSVDQESMIFPYSPLIQSNYYSPPLEQDTFSSKDDHINTKYTNYDQLQKSTLFSITSQGTENNYNEERMKKRMRSTATERRKRRLVYHPFALVKPGGEEGDITLNDINTRMLMPPTRPIPHPVGHFASRPSHRPGKPILALTTIRTLGTGTLTIITT